MSLIPMMPKLQRIKETRGLMDTHFQKLSDFTSTYPLIFGTKISTRRGDHIEAPNTFDLTTLWTFKFILWIDCFHYTSLPLHVLFVLQELFFSTHITLSLLLLSSIKLQPLLLYMVNKISIPIFTCWKIFFENRLIYSTNNLKKILFLFYFLYFLRSLNQTLFKFTFSFFCSCPCT